MLKAVYRLSGTTRNKEKLLKRSTLSGWPLFEHIRFGLAAGSKSILVDPRHHMSCLHKPTLVLQHLGLGMHAFFNGVARGVAHRSFKKTRPTSMNRILSVT